MASIRDVAREAGVSVTTVSIVLNNTARPVSPQTRERVKSVATRLNYYPDAVARGLVRRRTNSIGLLFSTIQPEIVTNNYAQGILAGVLRASTIAGFDIHLFTQTWARAAESAPAIKAQRPDGVLVVAPTRSMNVAGGLAKIGLPVVVLSAPSGDDSIPYVDLDNFAAGQLATRHFLELGHKRIAFLAGSWEQSSVSERLDGVRAALASAGLTLPDEYVTEGSFDQTVARREVKRLLTLPEPPTAILATNDDLAWFAVEVARDLGLRVPDDLSVIGCDNYPISAVREPGLTTIDHPLGEIGATAATFLIDLIEGREAASPRLFVPHIKLRNTTAPPRRMGSE